jgi:hypothetical protein
MVKVLVFGSRSIADYDTVKNELERLNAHVADMGDSLDLISGGAIGVDTLAEQFAKEYELPIEVYKPQYHKFQNKNLAPLARNTQMVADCDWGMCFWDGVSKGTLHTIKEMAKAGKTVYIYGVKEVAIINPPSSSEEAVSFINGKLGGGG